MQRLNIFVVHPSEMLTDHLPHGAGWIVYNYLKGLADRGHTVHVAVPRLELRDPVPAGMHVHQLAPPKGGMLNKVAYIFAIRALLKRLSKTIKFDLAQQFTPVEAGLSFSVLGTGIPLVLGPYSGHWPVDADGPAQRVSFAKRLRHKVRDVIAWLQQQQASALVVTCPAAMERVLSSSARATRVHVISHGIDSKTYRQRDGLPEKPSILFLANLEYRKGIFTLLDAFERVAVAVPECTLQVWGAGPQGEAVKERVARSAYRDRIVLHGRASRDAVAQIMRSPSLFCMPSFGEPFGMTLLESMASGIPVVATDYGGPPFIVHPAGGRIVPMRDVEKLAAALIEVLSDRELQNEMGMYNRRRVEGEFDWSRQLDRMETVYGRVLQRRVGLADQTVYAE